MLEISFTGNLQPSSLLYLVDACVLQPWAATGQLEANTAVNVHSKPGMLGFKGGKEGSNLRGCTAILGRERS